LPDGLSSNQKSQIWVNFGGLAKENLDIFYDHLVYFTAIGNILWPFGHLMVIWYISSRFGILYQEKSGNPAQEWFRRRNPVSCSDCSISCPDENKSSN
jgi:hypothetical protein